MKFLFMDETYSDPGSPAPATVLTELLISADAYPEIRRRFYELVIASMPTKQNVIEPMPMVHASNLFRHLGDDDEGRFTFFEGLCDIILETDLRIYRVGYLRRSVADQMTEPQTIGLCFLGFLWSLGDALAEGPVWPVMESDRTTEQDRQFAVQIRDIGYHTMRLGPANMSIDNSNLGELLYVTKASSLGALVECVAYLRQAVYLRATGATLTPFKSRLADIGARLDAAITIDEVIEMNGSQPEGAIKGPVRQMVPIIPSDL